MTVLNITTPKQTEQGVRSQAQSILLLSCYELGHQPLSLAWPAAFLEEAGFSAEAVDLSLEPFPKQAAKDAGLVGIAVPMHTALRLGVQAAKRVRRINPEAHICFYGLYAWLNRDYLLRLENGVNGRSLADSVLSGEYDVPSLCYNAVLSSARCGPRHLINPHI